MYNVSMTTDLGFDQTALSFGKIRMPISPSAKGYPIHFMIFGSL